MNTQLIAFHEQRQVATGGAADVAIAINAQFAQREAGRVLVFERFTGRQTALDLRGSPDQIRARYPAIHLKPKPRSESQAEVGSEPTRGRPRLGVVGREVTLLPAHWAWLENQGGGASAALRRLVDEARRTYGEQDAQRHKRDVTGRFMQALGSNLSGFDEGLRALYNADYPAVAQHIEHWPADVRSLVLELLEVV